ncbi:MAG: CPBP family intramembrane glutamic endopeptidase [Polyangiales bacterium]
MIPARLLPFVATALVGLSHALAWRNALGLSAWLWLGLAYGPLLVWSIAILRRDEVLSELIRPVPGDLTKGILAAALCLGALYGVALLGIKLAPATCSRDLLGIVRVAASVPTMTRGIGVVVFSLVEELVWRGAVRHSLEERVGSSRATWMASGLFFIAMVPSLHPSLIVAAAILGVATAFVVARFRRLTVAAIVHAFFTWITVELILPTLWQRIQSL